MRISLDGQEIEAREGDTVAAALLRAGVTTFTRSIKYHRPRGPFCLAGSCGQCLMRVDGVPSLPACRVKAEEGMACERQNAPLGAEKDLFRAADFLFSEGLDHHHLFTGSRVLGRVALEIARRLAGLGELPGKPRPPGKGELREVPLAVIGAGPAGLAAARAAAEQGVRPLLIERAGAAGGAALLALDSAAPGAAFVAEQEKALRSQGAEILFEAPCVGLYANDTDRKGNALVVVWRREGLLVAVAERVIVATGGASQPLPFPGVDRPGVYAARGLLELHARCGVRVGDELAVVGSGRELEACAAALGRAGYQVVRSIAATPRRALGNPVRGLDVDGERIRCDAVALAHPPAPLHDLASSVGATARWDGNGFPVETDAQGRTAVSWLFAAGSVAGKPAIDSGQAAGRSSCL
ncbi:MAG TPA: 2Fe-2S iron-sulfur cluster-binding protein [Myxococcales bacterium]|nr:2Fe-2S iron-sulfur cluster-binding protein [Myxococcales bacterium]